MYKSVYTSSSFLRPTVFALLWRYKTSKMRHPGGILFFYWTWPREELQIHRYENLVCPGAHKILWLFNEELKLGIMYQKGGQMINNPAVV